MIHPTLADGESFVEGRSTETARKLVEAAGDRAGEVRTTSHGYIVPTDLVPDGVESITNADTAAVITEPGTSTNVEEVWNVGGAPTAAAEQSEDAVTQFDPAEANVDEVNEYLAGADAEERERVLALEAEGKNRKGIKAPETEEG